MTVDWQALNRAIPEPRMVLPHREPLLLVDRVVEITENSVVSEMCLSSDAPVFAGHFPGDPTVPGVYLIEAVAQTLAFHQRILFPEQSVLLATVKSAKFRKVVRPNDRVLINVSVLKSKLRFIEGIGEAHVQGQLVAEVHCLGTRVPPEGG